MLERDEALKLVREKVDDERYVKHMLAVEAIMRGLAKRMGEDEDLWGLTGLLHDLDYVETEGDMSRHGKVTVEIIGNMVPEEVSHAILAHNEEGTGVTPKTKLDKALIAADAISGLIIATALVMPNKRLSEVKVKSVRKKFKSKDFARGVSRERIIVCEELGLELSEFIEIALESMKEIAGELGL